MYQLPLPQVEDLLLFLSSAQRTLRDRAQRPTREGAPREFGRAPRHGEQAGERVPRERVQRVAPQGAEGGSRSWLYSWNPTLKKSVEEPSGKPTEK